MDLKTLVKLPLKNAFDPSSLAIFLQQSMVLLYIFSPSPDIIISLRLTVSKGYATETEQAATVWAIANLVAKLAKKAVKKPLKPLQKLKFEF